MRFPELCSHRGMEDNFATYQRVWGILFCCRWNLQYSKPWGALQGSPTYTIKTLVGPLVRGKIAPILLQGMILGITSMQEPFPCKDLVRVKLLSLRTADLGVISRVIREREDPNTVWCAFSTLKY